MINLLHFLRFKNTMHVIEELLEDRRGSKRYNSNLKEPKKAKKSKKHQKGQKAPKKNQNFFRFLP